MEAHERVSICKYKYKYKSVIVSASMSVCTCYMSMYIYIYMCILHFLSSRRQRNHSMRGGHKNRRVVRFARCTNGVPAPSDWWCLNPRGTLSHPFGTLLEGPGIESLDFLISKKL